MPGITGYFGGKNSMSKWIYSFIPKNIEYYIEIFSGSFAIYFNENFDDCKNIIYNDFNKLQTNFMHCCMDYNKMLFEIEKSLLPGGSLYCDRSEINDIKKYYRDLYTDIKNPLKNDFYDNMDFDFPDYNRGVIYSFMISSAFNSCHARGAGFSGFSSSGKLKLNTIINKLNKDEYRKKIDKISKIEYLDFEKLIEKYDSEKAYFYADPPYKHTDGNGTHDKDYGSEHIFGDESHYRLAKLLQNAKARWSLSYYYFPELEEWYPKNKYYWYDKEFHRSSASFSNDTKGKELLILNYNPETGEKLN
jgi:DNA adenine methylase